MKKCPISNFPIDIMTLDHGNFQVLCPKSRWFSPVFSDVEEAIAFRTGVDVLKELNVATREEKNGQARLVGKQIMTRFMPPEELDALLPAKPKARAVSK